MKQLRSQDLRSNPLKAARVGQLARKLFDIQPLTTGGLGLVIAGLCLYVFVGEDKADYVAHAVGLFSAAAVCVCALATAMGALSVYRAASRPRPELTFTTETGAERHTGFSITSLRWWPLVQLELTWTDPSVRIDSVQMGSLLTERMTPLQRGRHAFLVRRFRIYDIFGLSSVTLSRRYPADITVSPAKTGHHLSMAVRTAGGDGYSHPDGSVDGELVDMRRYAPGDPGRLILWKAFARSRRLLVRTPERALTPTPTTVAFLVAGPGDEAAASTARTFVEEGLLGSDVVFAADGAERPAESDAEATDQIIDSVGHRDSGGQGLGRMSQALGRSQLANCVIFCPTQTGPWVDLLAAFNRQLPAPATAIIGVELSVTSPPRSGRWARLLWQQSERTDPALVALPGLVQTLQSHGIRVQLVHRDSGQHVSLAQLEAIIGTTIGRPRAAA